MHILRYSIILQIISTASLNINSEPAVKRALASQIENMMSYFFASNYAGLPTENEKKDESGFQWFEGGIYWGILAEYIRITGDTKHEAIMFTSLATASNGVAGSFLGASPELAALTGKWNDDILWWAMGPLTNSMVYGQNVRLPGGQSLVTTAKNTYDEVWKVWDDACGGGLYWSRNIAKSAGYKSSITNAQQMFIGAQLAFITGDQSYNRNGDRIIEWFKGTGIIRSDFAVGDGIDRDESCKLAPGMFSYTPGLMLGAFGWMFKTTRDVKYINDAKNIMLKSLETFAPGDILTDPCEPSCARNSVSFKGAFARGLGHLYETSENEEIKTIIKRVLSKSIEAMAASCTDEWSCSNNWSLRTPPSVKSVHAEMNSIELLTAYYKTLGQSVKTGLAPPANAGNATDGNNVPSLPKNSALPKFGGVTLLLAFVTVLLQ